MPLSCLPRVLSEACMASVIGTKPVCLNVAWKQQGISDLVYIIVRIYPPYHKDVSLFRDPIPGATETEARARKARSKASPKRQAKTQKPVPKPPGGSNVPARLVVKHTIVFLSSQTAALPLAAANSFVRRASTMRPEHPTLSYLDTWR